MTKIIKQTNDNEKNGLKNIFSKTYRCTTKEVKMNESNDVTYLRGKVSFSFFVILTYSNSIYLFS